MKLIKTDTFIVTILTLALFSFVKSLEASPLHPRANAADSVQPSRHALTIPDQRCEDQPPRLFGYRENFILPL